MSQVLLSPDAIINQTHPDDGTRQVASDIAYRRLAIVNVAFLGVPGAGDGGWVLVDTGLPGFADSIVDAARQRFGENAKPAAIILTHGHFDHIGCLEKLLEHWEVPVYAHPLEFPYLTGHASYPPADTMVGGGIMPLLAPAFPRGPIDVSRWLKALPEDGSLPGLPGWRWLHTPGHCVGHVSLWRDEDRALIAGDAFITTAQESAYAVAIQKPEMHGPPRYFTGDWDAARESVRVLAALEPELAVAGHGQAVHGPLLRAALHELAARFDEVARPEHGRTHDHPDRIADGTAYREP